jgi:capsid protein
MRDIQEFMDSEAIRLRQLANTGIIVSAPGYVDDDEEFEAQWGPRRPGPDAHEGPGGPQRDLVDPRVDPMEPGGVVKVPPGWKAEQTQPGDVGSSFGEFLRKSDSRSALGAGVPYGRFADDYGSYSSDRIAKIADRDFDTRMSRWRNQILIAQFIRPVIKRLIIAAYVSGAWKPGGNVDLRQVYSCEMHLPRRDNVHQLQGEQAEDLAVAAGRESADDVAAKRGKSGAAVDMANAVATERKRLMGIPVKDPKTGGYSQLPPPPDTPVAKMITRMALDQIQREIQAAQGGPRTVKPMAIQDQVSEDDLPTDTFDSDDTDMADGMYVTGPVGTVVPT